MRTTTLFSLILLAFSGQSQALKPGFDAAELTEVLCVSARTGSGASFYTDTNHIDEPARYTFAYRSPEIGLLNLWELWTADNRSAIISIRGTIPDPDSWLANFYAAMVPARGQLTLPGQDTFPYDLSPDPKAAVHIGWLISMAYLSRDMLPRIDSCLAQGIREFIVTGHSQGGGIAYLMTAHLMHLKSIGRLPADMTLKTYCTAAPKPGNLYFAYTYEAATAGGWAYNIVNTADWVPEVPISIQTLDDFNEVNPFDNARAMIRKQGFPKNLVLKHVYGKLYNPAKRAQRNYEKYLGDLLAKQIQKKLIGLDVPEYYPSNHYVRTGQTILLEPTPEYVATFTGGEHQFFRHHMHHSYLFLLDPSTLIAD